MPSLSSSAHSRRARGTLRRVRTKSENVFNLPVHVAFRSKLFDARAPEWFSKRSALPHVRTSIRTVIYDHDDSRGDDDDERRGVRENTRT